MAEPAARVLARFCADLRWDRIPAPARYRTQELLLDHIGVTFRGSAAESSARVREYVRTQGAGPATILGASRIPWLPEAPARSYMFISSDGSTETPESFKRAYGGEPPRMAAATAEPPMPSSPRPLSASAAWAALANGTAAHAIEMDDVTTESSLHPGAAVIPAALAVGQDRVAAGEWIGHERDWPGLSRPSGADVLAAIVCGYEVTIRVGNALGAASSYRRGFHPTGVAGVFGAAVAAGRLMHLDADGLTRAIGIAGTMASGSLAYLDDGSWTKRLNPGWAAHAGVVAAGLAFAGFTGPETALEGSHGSLRGYTDEPHEELLTAGLGSDDLQVMRVSIKPYGCCRYAHGLIDAVLALRAEHGITADDVAEMRLGVLSGGWPLIAEDIERKRDPRNTVDAQFSAPYAAAVALVRGRAGLREFEDPSDPAIRELMSRTECYRDPSLDAFYPKAWPAEVRIRLRDGREMRKRVDHALGEPENPLGRDGLVERFVEMVTSSEPGRSPLSGLAGLQPEVARAVAERILHFENETDLSVLETLA